MSFVPTRAAGLARLAEFIDQAGHDYTETRNFDRGPGNRKNVSMLSPHLRHRLVTEAEVVAAVRKRHRGDAAAKFVQEVLWRTYWKGWLELRPSVYADYLGDVAALEAQNGGWRADYAKAVAGNTGIDCFDAWIDELAEHGYLHNHARMWFASIWIFTLRLPWQLGAALFWHHLYDGDAASNTLSWRWVAGLQTAGKTYLASADNIARFTEGRFSPSGLAEVAVPVGGTPHPKPVPLPAADRIPAGPIGLLVAEDDLASEMLVPATQVAAVATIDVALSPALKRSPAVTRFIADACDDAGRRAALACEAPATALGTADAAAIASWAASHGLAEVVVGYAPVGPGAAALSHIGNELRDYGIRLSQVRRQWDEDAWPHAQRGFFAFKEAYAG